MKTVKSGTAIIAEPKRTAQRGEPMKPPYEDYCYECGGYGDDYYIDDDGELKCRCSDCPYWDCEDDDE